MAANHKLAFERGRRSGYTAANVLGELRRALLERPCEVHGPDMKIKAVTPQRYHYPDVSVVCGQPLFEDETQDVLLNPKLIVEVLSYSTERSDRGDKFTCYRTLGALEDDGLVSQTAVLVEHYHRLPDGTWLCGSRWGRSGARSRSSAST